MGTKKKKNYETQKISGRPRLSHRKGDLVSDEKEVDTEGPPLPPDFQKRGYNRRHGCYVEGREGLEKTRQ